MDNAVQQAQVWMQPAIELGMSVGQKVIGAILLWFIGKFLIRMALSLADKALSARNIDATVRSYAASALGVLFNVLLIIAVLSVFGVETTTFAGILAAAGAAIGFAWSGLLAHFAAGIFLLVLRPFKVGDLIQTGDTLGAVAEIGLFVTAIDTLDNVRTFVGNNTIFSGKIQNFTANPFRRVDCVAQLAHSVDHNDAIERLHAAIGKIENTTQKADIHILEFNLAGPVLCVRPYCHNDNYWQVYFDTNKAIRETFGAAGYATPENHYHIRQAG